MGKIHAICISHTHMLQLSTFQPLCYQGPLVKTELSWWLRWQRICLQCGRPGFDPWLGKIPWRRDRLPTPVFLGFPCGSAGKESACNAGDQGSIPELGRSPGEKNSYPLQYACLENSIDRGAWWATVHGVLKCQTRRSD